MANPFLNKTELLERDIETALLLEQANVLDIGNAVAYTDGDRVFINTEDNLFNILPAYDTRMLKWLLWHEKMHLELKHHNRFFKYVEEFEKATSTPAEAFSEKAIEKHAEKFNLAKEEVNIIMDILVHDWMADKFPELVETALNNLAQFRDRNSLKYTFKHNTLEEMLEEYSQYKKGDDGEGTKDGEPSETKDGDSEGEGKKGKGKSDKPTEEKPTEEEKTTEDKLEEKTDAGTKGHSEGGSGDEPKDDTAEDGEPEMIDDPGEHDKTDWSKLQEIDSKEFITREEGERYIDKINELKRKKIRLAKLTETLNGLVTSTRRRSYAMPSPISVGGGVILKGSTPGRTQLYLCFDASGSMGSEMETFKDIISKSIPQAMDTPTAWFSGYGAKITKDESGRSYDYYKGKFKDFMPVRANNGYNDDGDRTIELCYLAEQQGYSPIGITDGGGRLSWSVDMIKQLKRTVLVGQNGRWLEQVQKINPRIQILVI